MLYNVISAIPQSESDTCIHISPFSWISFPFRSLQSIALPVLYSRFSLFICFIHSSVYISVPISQFTLLLLSSVSRVWLCVTPRTVAHQAPLSIKFSRHEYWSGLPCPPPEDPPNPGIKPGPMALQADSLSSEPPGKPPIHSTLT